MYIFDLWHRWVLIIVLVIYSCDCAYVSLSQRSNSLSLSSQSKSDLANNLVRNDVNKELTSIESSKIDSYNKPSTDMNNEATSTSSQGSSSLSNSLRDLGLFFSNIFSTDSASRQNIALKNSVPLQSNKLATAAIDSSKLQALEIQPMKQPEKFSVSVAQAKLTGDSYVALNSVKLVKTISLERIANALEPKSEVIKVTKDVQPTSNPELITQVLKVEPTHVISKISNQHEIFPITVTKNSNFAGELQKTTTLFEKSKNKEPIVYITTTIQSNGVSDEVPIDSVTIKKTSSTGEPTKKSSTPRLGIQAGNLAILSQNSQPSDFQSVGFVTNTGVATQHTAISQQSISQIGLYTQSFREPTVTSSVQTQKDSWWNDEVNLKLNYYLELGNAVVGAGYIVEEVVDVVSGLKVTEYITSHFTSSYIMTSVTTPYTLNVTSLEYVLVSSVMSVSD